MKNGGKPGTNGLKTTHLTTKDTTDVASVVGGSMKLKPGQASTISKHVPADHHLGTPKTTSRRPIGVAMVLKAQEAAFSFTLISPLPTLNEHIAALGKHRMTGGRLKKQTQESLAWEMFKLPKIERPGVYVFTWYVKNMRTDPDNIAFAKKFIFDALQETGKLPNDSLKWVLGFEDHFIVGEPKVRVDILFY